MASKKIKNSEDFEEVYIEPDVPIYTTGIVCKILKIPIWVLKQLDKEGIVSPARKNEGESRLYSKRELKEAQRCWFFMEKHSVKIPGLKVILEMEKGTFKIKKKR
ncbi:MAG: MerR family transcriptional regulator [Candidatus Omnitrophica bacterium]|nr:MerR family transcriptional regulator [Candidatus Omnitrophota bacterium]